jgi:hypothetical protein
MSDAIDSPAAAVQAVSEKSENIEKQPEALQTPEVDDVPLEDTFKSRWDRSWPVIACGAGLFSDGYLNGVRFLLPH